MKADVNSVLNGSNNEDFVTPYTLKIWGSKNKGGGGGSYVLTPATKTKLGGVIVGNNLEVLSDGTLNAKGTTVSVKVGSTQTSAPGSSAKVTNSGTDKDVFLDFVIPRGEQGVKGDRGPLGPIGPVGPQGPQGDSGIFSFDVVGNDLIMSVENTLQTLDFEINRDGYLEVTFNG